MRFLLGLDPSEGSQAAARWCARLAAASDAEVVVVHGLGILPEFIRDLPPTALDLWMEALRKAQERWAAPLREAGVRYRARLVDADPVDALLEVADEEEPDLIVVGAQARHGVLDRFLGGVPYKLAHRSRYPVTLVPATSRTSPDAADDVPLKITEVLPTSSGDDKEEMTMSSITARCRACGLFIDLEQLVKATFLEGHCPNCGRPLADDTELMLKTAARVLRTHRELLDSVRVLVSLPGNLELLPHSLVRDFFEDIDWGERVASDRELVRLEIEHLERVVREWQKSAGEADGSRRSEMQAGLGRLSGLLRRLAVLDTAKEKERV
jgi:nucleotide-binding universal stress UspA family protein